MIISRSILLRMTKVSDKSCRENQNTLPRRKHTTLILCSVNFSPENHAVYEISHVWKKCCTCIAGQTTDDDTAHVHCMLDS